MMANPVPLNNVDHAGLRVALRSGAEHGDAVNQMLLLPTEFAAASREFPIVFREMDGAFQALALLGMDRDENLFLADGGWSSRYVPAVQRRGPFMIGLQRAPDGSGGEPMIHIDLDDRRVSEAGDGEPLFRPQGGNSSYLDHVAKALGEIHEGAELAKTLYPAWVEAGLLAPVTFQIALDEATRCDVPDIWIVSETALGGLDAEALGRLHREGFLAPAFYAFASLGTVPHLVARKNARRAAR